MAEDTTLDHLSLADQYVPAFPQHLVGLILAMLVIGILVGGTQRDLLAVAEDKSVDGSDHVGICQATWRGDEVAGNPWGRTYRQFLPGAVDDHAPGEEQGIQVGKSRLGVWGDVLLVAKRDVADGYMVLHDVVSVPALGVQILELITTGDDGDRNREIGNQVGNDVLIVEVVAEYDDVGSTFETGHLAHQPEYLLRRMSTEGISDDDIRAVFRQIERLRIVVTHLLQALRGGIFDRDEVLFGDGEIEMFVVALQIHRTKFFRIPVDEIQVGGHEVLHIRLELFRITGGHLTSTGIVAGATDVAITDHAAVMVSVKGGERLHAATLDAEFVSHEILLGVCRTGGCT